MARRDAWGFYRTTSAGDIEIKAQRAIAKAQRQGFDWHPVIITGRSIAKSWWGQSWCRNLERYADYENRLPRGRTYVRNSAVVDLTLGQGEVLAKVQGSSLYSVHITFDPLPQKVQKELGKVCSEQIQNVEALISGSFPEALKERLYDAKGGLFPSPREIHFRCSCPDWASMCKHVAAVMYGIGARLDEQPLGFFDLRGIKTDEFVAKAVEDKVESMLQNAAARSSRVISDGQLSDLFGLDIGGMAPPLQSVSEAAPAVEAAPSDAEPPKKKRGRPPKAAAAPAAPVHTADMEPPRAARISAPAEAKRLILEAGYSGKVTRCLLLIQKTFPSKAFDKNDVMKALDCSPPTAVSYIKRLKDELQLIEVIPDRFLTKYRFVSSSDET